MKQAVAEEADSEIHQRTVERELAGQPPLTDAEKQQIQNDYASGRARADVPGQPTYADYHGASWDRVKNDPNAEVSPAAPPWDWLSDLVGDAVDFGKGVVEGLKQQGLDLWNDIKKLGGVAGDFASAVVRGDLEGAIAPFKQAFNEAWEEIKSLGPNAVKAFENIKDTILNGNAHDKGVLLGGVIGVGAKTGGGGPASAARGIVGFVKRRAGIDDKHHDDSGRQVSEVVREHQTLEQARNAALAEIGDLGHDRVPTRAKDFSDVPGQIQGFQSADGKRGFRIDWDPEKGIHYNWYDWTSGKKGEGGRWGAETWPGTKEDYLRLIAQLNDR